MRVEDQDQAPEGSPEGADEHRYRAVLGVGVRVILAVLAAALALYLSGAVRPHVPLDELPGYWTLPSADFVERTGMPTGWSWIGRLNEGDVLTMIPAALLATMSAVCLAAILPIAVRQGDYVFVAVIVLQLALFAVAAFAG